MYTWTIKLNNRQFNIKAKKGVAEDVGGVLAQLTKIHQYCRELTGVHGGKESAHVFMSLFGSGGGVMANPEKFEADRDAFFNSLPDVITEADIPDIIRRAGVIFNEHVPVKDSRETPDEIEARNAETTRLEAERREKSLAWIDAHCQSREKVKIPAGYMAVVVEINYDDSDSMTDYFDRHHAYGQPMLLAIVKKQAQTERLCRAGVAKYPELAALTWTWHTENYSMGHGNWLESGAGACLPEIKTYGGYTNPPCWYEVSCQPWETALYAYKGYPGSQPSDHPADRAKPGAPASNGEEGKAGGAAYTVEHERDWTWIRFEAKPAEEVREALKDAFGARFSGKRVAWYITRHVEAAEIAAAMP